MFGMRGNQPPHSDPGYPQHSSCLPTESKMVPSMHQSSMSSGSGSGDQVASTETPPQTPPNQTNPNGLKLAGSTGMNQLTDPPATSYHGHVQPHNPYTSQYNNLHSYDDKTMVPQYANDSINNIYNVTNNRT